jgi:uncharacterized membrane protein YdbT with pleckstrin-like domain
MQNILEEVTFEGKKENEKLIVFTRRHWFVLVGYVVGVVIAAFIPFVFIILLAKVIVAHEGASILFMFIWMIYIMILWYLLIYKLTMHTLDTWIVTDDRVMDIVQIGFFDRKVSELHLEAIQDISVNTKGLVQSYLNFGNIEVQTGATAQRFMFDQVPRPIEIKDKVMEAANKFVQGVKQG